jgi:hypothetical protein
MSVFNVITPQILLLGADMCLFGIYSRYLFSVQNDLCIVWNYDMSDGLVIATRHDVSVSYDTLTDNR